VYVCQQVVSVAAAEARLLEAERQCIVRLAELS
jgi:hypothetical protein